MYHPYWWGFWSLWWLIFPIMGLIAGLFSMWMSYRTHHDRMELMKAYIAQGKDPAELAKAMGDTVPDYWGEAWGAPSRWRHRRWGGGPFREWRRFIIFACLAGGFYLASQYADYPGAEHAFTFAAIIMGVMALASFGVAVLSTVMFRRMGADVPPKNGG